MVTNYISEELGRLISAEGELVVGTHMSPPRVIGDLDPQRPQDAFRIEWEIAARGLRVLVTRSGGLFVRPPENLVSSGFEGFDEKFAFMSEAAAAINVVLCEAALTGAVSSPASPVQMSSGKVVDDHAIITGGGGGREVYLDRTADILLDVIGLKWMTWVHVEPALFDIVASLPRAPRLLAMASALPELVVGAYSNLSRHHAPEAIVDGWVVIEQLLDVMWQEFVAGVSEPGRAEILKDTRSFTAAVRADVLLTAGKISPDLWRKVTRARKYRNELAHRARVSIGAAQSVCSAMQSTVERILGTTVDPPLYMRHLTW